MKEQEIQRYLIPVERSDWDDLLADWHDLIPKDSTRWMLTRFGDLVMEQRDGNIGLLRATTFAYECVAESKLDFVEWLDDPERLEDWFHGTLTDELERSGGRLRPETCYHFIMPLGLGGRAEKVNVSVILIHEAFTGLGQIFRQMARIPVGTQMILKPKQ